MFSDRTFNEIDSDISKSFFVNNGNARDIISFDEVQKCEKARSFEVKSGSDIGDNLVVDRATLFDDVDLTLEITRVLFMLGRNTGVNDCDAFWCCICFTVDVFDFKLVFEVLGMISMS